VRRDLATNALLSRWRCFNAIVVIASGRRAARALVLWLCPQAHSSLRVDRRSTISRRARPVFQHKRGFCAKCGSRISGGENAEGTSPVVGINAASLDDPSWFRPQYDIFTLDAQPWDSMNPALAKFKEYGTQ
jgi:hypothetical protein